MRIRRSVTVAALALTSVMGISATPAFAGCAGYTCVYDGTYMSGGGDYWNIADSNFQGDVFVNGVGENDAISSVDSYYSGSTFWYVDSWWGGSRLEVTAWSTHNTLSSTFNNRFSSFKYGS
ncbi:hypothetical protein ACFTWH_35360 [Streptomyces sp. NPDC057011]|uniref:hypothetical protein n=1 Tax=unclassified Streptomyces TaxID=2593676 RepID=UPI00362B080A